MIASVLACFNITNKKDENGNNIEVNGDIEDNGLMTYVLVVSFLPALTIYKSQEKIRLRIPSTILYGSETR